MVIDASAILTIVFFESEAERMATAIANAPVRTMSALNWLEVMLVVEARLGRTGADKARLILQELSVAPMAFDASQMHEALDAWRRYGKGRHPAALTRGDCCAYAAAVCSGQELLFKGNGFGLTEIAQAAW